jgi:hypothetical protein
MSHANLGLILFSRSLLLGRNDGIIYPVITFVKNWVMIEAIAAPLIPIIGISAAFKATFAKAPDKLIAHRYFCNPFARIHTLLTAPIYENVVYQTTSLKAPIA